MARIWTSLQFALSVFVQALKLGGASVDVSLNVGLCLIAQCACAILKLLLLFIEFLLFLLDFALLRLKYAIEFVRRFFAFLRFHNGAFEVHDYDF